MTLHEQVTEFFTKRFGRTPEQDQSYFDTWLSRFVKGSAWMEADNQSRRIMEEMGLDREQFKSTN